MNRETFRNSRSHLAVLGWFLAGGVLSGLVFAWLVSRPSLESFFFIKSDKFVIARYSYWWTLSLTQLVGLSAAYALCVVRNVLVQPISRVRLVSAALMVGLATPALRFITPVMNDHIGFNWDFVAAPFTFLFLLSCALCVLGGGVKLLPVSIVRIYVFTAAAVGLLYVALRTLPRIESYEFVEWPILYAMFALSFGSWLIWRQRVALKEHV